MLAELPVLPGLHVDARHVVGDRRHRPGRAWFDVVSLADGRTAILVGDVLELGPPAAACTERVRAILSHMFADRHDLDVVLEAMNKAVFGRGPAFSTTACVALVDPGSGNVQYCTCAHAPPLVVEADGRTRDLAPTGGEDTSRRLPMAVARARVAPGDMLVLHTGPFGPDSRRALAGRLAGAHSFRTDGICRLTAAELRRHGIREDFAVLAAQARSPVPRLELTVPAVPDSVESAGQSVTDWLAGLRSSVEDGTVMALAVGEAITNAIRHAFVGTRPGWVRVQAMLAADGVLVCSVGDDGRWLASELSEAGRRSRGLAMMARVCDRMIVHREPGGTVIELRRRLHHPVIRTA